MSSLIVPPSWVKTNLGDVAYLQNGFAFKSSTYIESGDFVIRIGNVQDAGINLSNPAYVNANKQNASKFKLDVGDIVLSLTGNVGRVAVIYEEHLPAVLNQRVARFIPSGNLNGIFLFYFLKSIFFQAEILKFAKGAAQLNISTKDVERIYFPVPAIAEQKIIADKLDDLLARVESIKTRLENIPEILKKFRQSVLVSAFQGHLTKEWRSKNFELKKISLNDIKEYWSEFYKKIGAKKAKLNLHVSDDIGNLPDTWLDTKIGFVFDVHVGATPSRNIKEYWNGDIPWVSSSEVAFSRIIKTKEKITVLGLDKTSTSIHPVGTVMLAMIGQGKTRGQTAILDIEACHNQNTAALRVPSGFAISEFLYLFLEKQYEETRRVGGGNNQQALNKSFVQSLGFPLPPIEEQIEIVENLNKLFHHTDIIQKQIDNALSQINNLTQSILAKAFRGELTAQWREENPELISGLNSAEALLEKITAEKLAADTIKKRAKKSSH